MPSTYFPFSSVQPLLTCFPYHFSVRTLVFFYSLPLTFVCILHTHLGDRFSIPRLFLPSFLRLWSFFDTWHFSASIIARKLALLARLTFGNFDPCVIARTICTVALSSLGIFRTRHFGLGISTLRVPHTRLVTRTSLVFVPPCTLYPTCVSVPRLYTGITYVFEVILEVSLGTIVPISLSSHRRTFFLAVRETITLLQHFSGVYTHHSLRVSGSLQITLTIVYSLENRHRHILPRVFVSVGAVSLHIPLQFFVLSSSFTFVSRSGTTCLLYTSPSPRDLSTSRMPSSA